MKNKRAVILSFLMICIVIFSSTFSLCVYGAEKADTLQEKYAEYRERLKSVTYRSEIADAGFRVIENQIFPIETECFGAVSMIPAMEKQYNRLVLFFAKEDGSIVYRTDQLAMNSRNKGDLRQPVRHLAAVSFQDLDTDGRMDIVLITSCVNTTGDYAGRPYKIGEVLFQKEEGFYQDYRISDKINRFSMNKSVECITSFVRDGKSTEFLYTATTKRELLYNGFQIAGEQCYFRQFEKLGRLEVVPGTYTMAEFSILMIYLINEQGEIVWSFQPMGDYDNLYALKGIACKDVDGDGMKDLLVLARYSDAGKELLPESEYSVYYQRTGGFYEDTDIQIKNPCTDTDTVSGLVEKARAYWGWEEK